MASKSKSQYSTIDSKSPAFDWRLQLSDSISSSPAEQAKSPAKLGLTNFVKHVSDKLLFQLLLLKFVIVTW